MNKIIRNGMICMKLYFKNTFQQFLSFPRMQESTITEYVSFPRTQESYTTTSMSFPRTRESTIILFTMVVRKIFSIVNHAKKNCKILLHYDFKNLTMDSRVRGNDKQYVMVDSRLRGNDTPFSYYRGFK